MAGRNPLFDYQPILDRIIGLITNRPREIIVVFLILTILFAVGLPLIELDPGEEGFTEGTPEQEALEAVSEEFEDPFEAEPQSTQIIQRGENVLSREGILRLLRIQERIESNPELRVEETSSVAAAAAQAIDPNAERPAEQIRVIESVTDVEVRQAVRGVFEEEPGLDSSLSDDVNREEPYASAALLVVDHDIPAGDDAEFRALQVQTMTVADSVDGETITFGGALLDAEFERALADSMTLMVPAVVIMILVFLLIAYRDPVDLGLGLVALCMSVVWTFGLIGHLGIPFNQIMIAIPSLLLAIGIDFGIHTVNRYREERVLGKGIHEGMRIGINQLLVAFFIVTAISAIGFGANMISDLQPIVEFGFVAALGICFTFLIFGIFMPAAKVWLDEVREGSRFPEFSSEPLGSPNSRLGAILPIGARISRRAPALVLAVLLVASLGAAAVGTDIDTRFDDEEFLPYEEPPRYIEVLPDQVVPEDYRVRAIVNFLEENFESGEADEVTVYIEGPMYESHVLESIHRAGEEPPDTVLTDGRYADSESIIDVIHWYADEDEEFADLVNRSDTSGNGVPDRNLRLIYDHLFASPFGDLAEQYLSEDLRSTRVIYQVDAEASQEEVAEDTREIADRNRLQATGTGTIVVFHTITELLLESALFSLATALGLTALFLIIIYRVLEGRALLGVANIVPIAVAVAFLAGTMVVIDIPFNAVTATVLAITIGIGIDYSVHLTHRFGDEYAMTGEAYPSLVTTMQGTGGGITGSMVTTVAGVGSLTLSVTPMMVEFGILMMISVFYSYLAAIIVLPPTLLLWARYFG